MASHLDAWASALAKLGTEVGVPLAVFSARLMGRFAGQTVTSYLEGVTEHPYFVQSLLENPVLRLDNPVIISYNAHLNAKQYVNLSQIEKVAVVSRLRKFFTDAQFHWLVEHGFPDVGEVTVAGIYQRVVRNAATEVAAGRVPPPLTEHLDGWVFYSDWSGIDVAVKYIEDQLTVKLLGDPIWRILFKDKLVDALDNAEIFILYRFLRIASRGWKVKRE